MCAQSKLDELQLQIAELADKVQDLEVAKAALASENSALREAAAARPDYFRNALVATTNSTTKHGVRTFGGLYPRLPTTFKLLVAAAAWP